MEIRFKFELIAVYPDADLHSQFCIITDSKIGSLLKLKMEEASGLSLPDKFIAIVRMEDGTKVCIFIDEYGISIMDEPAVHWWGEDTEIIAPRDSVVFFHYIG